VSQSFEEFAKDIVGYIRNSCPSKFYVSGTNDSAFLRFLYSISVPDTLIKRTAENEAKRRKRFCLSDIKTQILNEFKTFIRNDSAFSKRGLRSEVVPRGRLSRLKKILLALIVENLDEPMEVDFLKRIEKLKEESSNETIEKELHRIENDFYGFLLRNFPNAKSCVESSMRMYC
jgi:hypothetical protein